MTGFSIAGNSYSIGGKLSCELSEEGSLEENSSLLEELLSELLEEEEELDEEDLDSLEVEDEETKDEEVEVFGPPQESNNPSMDSG